MKNEKNLKAWLTSERFYNYLGHAGTVKIETLNFVLTGKGSIAAIAAKHSLTRQAVNRHAARVRKIWGTETKN
jgi:hypothetical protein